MVLFLHNIDEPGFGFGHCGHFTQVNLACTRGHYLNTILRIGSSSLQFNPLTITPLQAEEAAGKYNRNKITALNFIARTLTGVN